MILADSSAWIEYDRATGSPVHRRLRELVATDGPLAVTQPVIMEVTAGARTEARRADLARLLQRFTLRRFDADVDFDAAARLYAQCRRVGVTPRGLIDCMIMAVARRYGDTVLSTDADLGRLAGVSGVALDPASRDAG